MKTKIPQCRNNS